MTKEYELLSKYDINSDWFYEAFVDKSKGTLDYMYFAIVEEQDLSLVKLRDAIKAIRGSDTFPKKENTSSITKHEFLSKYYECAKFLYAKDWVRYMWDTHKILLVKSELFEWLKDNHPPHLSGYAGMGGYNNETSV